MAGHVPQGTSKLLCLFQMHASQTQACLSVHRLQTSSQPGTGLLAVLRHWACKTAIPILQLVLSAADIPHSTIPTTADVLVNTWCRVHLGDIIPVICCRIILRLEVLQH